MRMERRDAFEFYVDYLLSSPHMATATGLSAVLDNALKHDYISDCLAQNELDNKAFWREPGRRAVKPFVRQIEHSEAYLSIDDVIVAKPHSTENELICYHYDHTEGTMVKGINILNFMLSGSKDDQLVNCPLAWEVIRKTESYTDKSGKQKHRSPKTKNEMVLEHLHRIVFLNKVNFKYILFDSWFSASETLKYIEHKFKKAFVCPLKHNRLVALSEQDKQQGKFINVS